MINFIDGYIDYELQARRLFPYFWGETETPVDDVNINYLYSLLSGLTYSNGQLQLLFARLSNLQLKYTGQHLSLETMLNDFFDQSLRRIYIDENDLTFVSGVTLFLDGEDIDPPIDLYLDGEINPNPLTFFLDGENNSVGQYNFTVFLPMGVLFDLVKMRHYLDIFVLAGKRYNFELY